MTVYFFSVLAVITLYATQPLLKGRNYALILFYLLGTGGASLLLYDMTGARQMPDFPMSGRSISSEKKQRLDMELALYTGILRRHPQKVENWLAVAGLHLKAGNLVKAVTAFKGASAVEPANPKIRQALTYYQGVLALHDADISTAKKLWHGFKPNRSAPWYKDFLRQKKILEQQP
jgi:cytochrome c-type biogenesis protein CcmH/NrfG